MDESYHRRSETGALNSGLLGADSLVKTGKGKVYWLTVFSAQDVAIELNDSLDNSGTDQWGISLDVSVKNYGHFVFDPPIEFATGIYLDVSNTYAQVYVNYV